MGIAERREREKNERRRAILGSARDLILRGGVDRVSMGDIAKGAELSKATLYLYFPSKETILDEICEDSAKGFLAHLEQIRQAGLSGMEALRRLWRGYAKLFGNGDEMVVVFQIRSFLDTWPPAGAEPGQRGGGIKSPRVGAIVGAIRDMVDECKAEGAFDPGLDSGAAVGLVLSVFSTIMGNVARLPPEARDPGAMLGEMTRAFQIIVRGFAREGVAHARLDIAGAESPA